MQDIQRKKSKVINLRGKGKKPVQGKSVKVVVEETIWEANGGVTTKDGIRILLDGTKVQKSEPATQKVLQNGTFACIDCGLKEAIEWGRCKGCDTQHQEVVARLDSHPRAQQLERPPVQATYRKEASQGVIVTIQRLEPLR